LPKANSFLAGSDGSVALPPAAIATEADRQFLGQNFHLLDQISFLTHSPFPVHQLEGSGQNWEMKTGEPGTGNREWKEELGTG
jgi:hypothetical protein